MASATAKAAVIFLTANVAIASSSSSLTLPTPSDLLVHDLDQVVQAFGAFDGKMYAGSLPMDHVSTTVDGANADGLRTGFLQFWLFIPTTQAVPNTISAWFNGGPGCSSFSAGILFEHSPVTVPLHEAGWCCEPQNETLTPNEYGWTHATTMLYVEQPIGVGFSEATNDTPDPSSEDDVAADFDAFLQSFYKVFNGYNSDDSDEYDPSIDFSHQRLSLVGESYAGTYIPSVARQIYLNNKEKTKNLDGSPRIKVNLSGMAIGNGKIDALTQDPAVIDYAYWHDLIDGATARYLKAEWEHCMKNLEHGVVSFSDKPEPKPFHPFTIRDDCGVFDAVINAAGSGALTGLLEGGPNIYEYSTWDGYAAADGADGTVSKFYNNPKVQQALNVPLHRRAPHHKWQGCIPEVDPSVAATTASSSEEDNDKKRRRRLGHHEEQYDTIADDEAHHGRRRLNFMANDTPWSVTPYIAQLLDEAGIDVLIYSGDRDIICCTQGSEESLRLMDWSGTRESPASSTAPVTPYYNAWTASPRGLWLYDEYPAGYVKSYKNLSLVTVYNAGHMVRNLCQ
jgi:carboxypeptidase C (cathepsin A)